MVRTLSAKLQLQQHTNDARRKRESHQSDRWSVKASRNQRGLQQSQGGFGGTERRARWLLVKNGLLDMGGCCAIIAEQHHKMLFRCAAKHVAHIVDLRYDLRSASRAAVLVRA